MSAEVTEVTVSGERSYLRARRYRRGPCWTIELSAFGDLAVRADGLEQATAYAERLCAVLDRLQAAEDAAYDIRVELRDLACELDRGSQK